MAAEKASHERPARLTDQVPIPMDLSDRCTHYLPERQCKQRSHTHFITLPLREAHMLCWRLTLRCMKGLAAPPPLLGLPLRLRHPKPDNRARDSSSAYYDSDYGLHVEPSKISLSGHLRCTSRRVPCALQSKILKIMSG